MFITASGGLADGEVKAGVLLSVTVLVTRAAVIISVTDNRHANFTVNSR